MLNKTLFILLVVIGITVTVTSIADGADGSNIPAIQVIAGSTPQNTVYLDQHPVPEIIDGSVFVPVRQLSDALTLTLSWNEEKQTISLNKSETVLTFALTDKEATVNSGIVNIGNPPVNKDGYTYVPLRFVAEVFHFYIHFEKDFQGQPTVWITPYSLITAKDYTDLTDSYSKTRDITLDYGWQSDLYILNEKEQTFRGIGLGDTFNQVLQSYGVPFQQDLQENKSGTIMYPYLPIPFSEPSAGMLFTFDRGTLVQVLIF